MVWDHITLEALALGHKESKLDLTELLKMFINAVTSVILHKKLSLIPRTI